METQNENNIRYFAAKRRVKKMKGFYIHALVYVLVNTFIIVNNIRDGHDMTDINNYWTLIFWGLGLLVHGMSVFMSDFILGHDWEERKIREIMNRKR
ncbi:2TM domain-containing protein [Chryseobacterium sp.]|uniref:2TM domain-containing protein n=1 Tax=Chryseobacterium sp. TaxID=1871047 RepID=UPI0011C88662|nr:2TM domain-containing protein [Chryseobacterium sp.]TXF76071.1 2TM domain-containing protein [Chryseobacterium sp.]